MQKLKNKQIFNPFLPEWEHVPDTEPHIFNDRLYIYGTHDRYNGEAYCELPYVCWSAPLTDLSDWEYHGVIYDGKEDPLNDTGNHLLFAPDCIKKNGKYYLYYGLDDTSNAISVAISDCPEGPYKFYGHVKHKDGQIWGRAPQDRQQFDPGVFEDDDGTIYLYSGFSSTEGMIERIKKRYGDEYNGCKISTNGNVVVQLEEDMLTIKVEEKNVIPGVSNSKGTGFEGHEFLEASSMKKINNKYYMIYSSVNGHELCYAMSDYPDKNFVYKGVLHSNGNIGIENEPTYYYANNHGSLVEINGEYYIFGHRHTNHRQYARQSVVEKLVMNEDGTFNQAEMTSCGLNGKPLLGIGEYGTYIACVLMSKNGACKMDRLMDCDNHPTITEENKEAYISNIQNGSIVGFKYFDFNDLKEVSITVRSSTNGVMHVKTSLNDEDISTIQIETCNEWKTYNSKSICLNEIKPLYFIYEGEGKVDFKSFTLAV